MKNLVSLLVTTVLIVLCLTSCEENIDIITQSSEESVEEIRLGKSLEVGISKVLLDENFLVSLETELFKLKTGEPEVLLSSFFEKKECLFKKITLLM